MAVLGPGGDRPAPRAAAAQRRTARRDFLVSRGMARSSRGSHAACCVGWRRQGKKVAAAPLRAGDRGAARSSWPNPPIERPNGRRRTPAGRRRWRAAAAGIKVLRWHCGGRLRASTKRGLSGQKAAGRGQIGVGSDRDAPTRQGSGGSRRSALNSGFRGPRAAGRGLQPGRNGVAIRSRSWITMPSCVSSDQSMSQSAHSAEAAIVAWWTLGLAIPGRTAECSDSFS